MTEENSNRNHALNLSQPLKQKFPIVGNQVKFFALCGRVAANKLVPTYDLLYSAGPSQTSDNLAVHNRQMPDVFPNQPGNPPDSGISESETSIDNYLLRSLDGSAGAIRTEHEHGPSFIISVSERKPRSGTIEN